MKNLQFYHVPIDQYWSHEAKEAYEQALVDQINSERLTAAEREEKLRKVPSLVLKKENEINKPPQELQKLLDNQFWVDARYERGCSL